MVTILPPETNVGTDIGRALGQGLISTFEPALQQKYQKKQLQSAFNKIQPGANFLDQLKQIAPQLLSTPGGAQALSEIIGPMAQGAQSQGVRDVIANRRMQAAQMDQPQVPQGPGESPVSQGQVPQQQGQQAADFRNPKAPQSPLTPFPERTAGPQTQPEMSPRQLEDYATDIMEQTAAMGRPMSYPEAQQIALQKNNTIRESNRLIQAEKDRQELAQEKATLGMTTRADHAGYIKSPEDRTVASKLALEAKNAPNDEAAWEYVRTGLRDWETKKNGLVRNYQLPNPIEKQYQKLMGTYKDLETAEKQAQPFLDAYRKYGLYDEARATLSDDIGLGPDQIESWVFPLDKNQKMELDKFPQIIKKTPGREMLGADWVNKFPGETHKLDPEKYESFKENLHSFLNKNPGINLVTVRAKLNQDKRYAWQDISRAMNELIDEKRFNPDNVQEQQMTITNSAPIPGLAEQFQFLWKGKK